MRRLQQRGLGQEDLAGRPADRLSGRCGEHNAAERYVLLADDVMEHVKRAFAVAESGDATGIDGVAPGQDADGRYELFEVRAHAQLAERRPGILGGVRAGGPLVVANRRRTAGVRKRLGEKPAAAVGAGEQRGAPITVGGPLPATSTTAGNGPSPSGTMRVPRMVMPSSRQVTSTELVMPGTIGCGR